MLFQDKLENALGSLNVVSETKQDTNEEFVKKRKSGAAEIAKKASSKGGASKLTAWHFEAKAGPYAEAERAIMDGKPVSFFEKKDREAMRTLHSSGMRDQKTFQRLMGELEVWGEILLQVKSGHDYLG
jgi:hypothetical protein